MLHGMYVDRNVRILMLARYMAKHRPYIVYCNPDWKYNVRPPHVNSIVIL